MLTPFSGPLIEGSFNLMDDIITEDRSKLTVENYEAISSVKYSLHRKKMKSVNLKPCSKMRKNIRTAYTSYQEHLVKKKSKTHCNIPTTLIKRNEQVNSRPQNIDINKPSTSEFQIKMNINSPEKEENSVITKPLSVCLPYKIPKKRSAPADDEKKLSKVLETTTITNFFQSI